MGYTTDFEGQIKVSPPLNEAEISYIRDFNESRRMHRGHGPYYAVPGSSYGQNDPGDVIDYNRPGPEQPELWYQWVATDDGTAIKWDGGEKFYSSVEWMEYLIDTFLRDGATVQRELANPVEGRYYDPRFADFTFDHVLNGRIEAQGEDVGDHWRLLVTNNHVRKVEPTFDEGDDPDVPVIKLTVIRDEDTADGQAKLAYNTRELTAWSGE